MKSFVTLTYHFAFSERPRSETRSDYIITVLENIKEKAEEHQVDIIQISAEMFKNDVKNFEKILDVTPSSVRYLDFNKLSVTFKIPADKLRA